jgi:hypothetical protein
MDNHPIPQDVTGFQFKLIGSMTVKQFGYVIFGVILAVILYYLPIQSGFAVLMKVLLIPIVGISGFLIAFLPIEGRPVDVMVGNFIKALFLPNQFVYHKTGRLFNFATVATHGPLPIKHASTTINNTSNKAQQLRQALQAAHTKKPNKLDEREAAFLQSVMGPTNTLTMTPVAASSSPVAPTPQLQAVQQPAPIPSAQDALAQQETLLREQLAQAKKDEQVPQTTGDASAAHQKAALLERQVQTLHFQRQQLEQQLAHLQNQLALQQKAAQPATPKQPAPQPVKTPPQEPVKKTGLPHVPDTPNVIVGIVKDPRGNVLPNMLVEVKDKDGNPVRAFKTNALGQFASATPLAPGTYTVELEDPKKQNRFDVIQLAATNQILLPIEIISHDAREELRKQLFN